MKHYFLLKLLCLSLVSCLGQNPEPKSVDIHVFATNSYQCDSKEQCETQRQKLKKEIASKRDKVLKKAILVHTGSLFDRFTPITEQIKFLENLNYDAITPTMEEYKILLNQDHNLPLILTNLIPLDKNAPRPKAHRIIKKNNFSIAFMGVNSSKEKIPENYYMKDEVEASVEEKKKITKKIHFFITLSQLNSHLKQNSRSFKYPSQLDVLEKKDFYHYVRRLPKFHFDVIVSKGKEFANGHFGDTLILQAQSSDFYLNHANLYYHDERKVFDLKKSSALLPQEI